MTVQELFGKVNFRKIGEHIMDSRPITAAEAAKSEEEKEAIRLAGVEKIYEASRKMLEIEVLNDPEKIITCVWIEAVYPDDEAYMDASLCYRTDLINKELRIRDFDAKDPLSVTDEEYREKYIESYAFEFSDWREILGAEVADTSIEEYGAEAVAEGIFHEMTFFGLDYEDSEKNRKEELDRLDESVREAQEHPETCHPLEELWDELGFDPPTEEETERDYREFIEAEKVHQKENVKIMERLIQAVKKQGGL